jgi:hypothetical protein
MRLGGAVDLRRRGVVGRAAIRSPDRMQTAWPQSQMVGRAANVNAGRPD